MKLLILILLIAVLSCEKQPESCYTCYQKRHVADMIYFHRDCFGNKILDSIRPIDTLMQTPYQWCGTERYIRDYERLNSSEECTGIHLECLLEE